MVISYKCDYLASRSSGAIVTGWIINIVAEDDRNPNKYNARDMREVLVQSGILIAQIQSGIDGAYSFKDEASWSDSEIQDFIVRAEKAYDIKNRLALVVEQIVADSEIAERNSNNITI